MGYSCLSFWCGNYRTDLCCHAVGTQIDRGVATLAAISSFSSIGGLKWTDQIVAADTWTEQTVASDTWTNQTNPTTTWTDLDEQEVA